MGTKTVILLLLLLLSVWILLIQFLMHLYLFSKPNLEVVILCNRKNTLRLSVRKPFIFINTKI